MDNDILVQILQNIILINERITKFEEKVDARFDAIDNKFKEVDARFDAIDNKFKEVDARFDAIDNKFKEVDARFDAIDNKFKEVDARFDAIDNKFKEVNSRSEKTDTRFDAIDSMLVFIHKKLDNVIEEHKISKKNILRFIKEINNIKEDIEKLKSF